MPQLITCPDCGRKLRVPDNLIGKKVKCPGCGQKFVGEADENQGDDEAPVTSSSSVAARPSDDPPPRRRAAEDEEEDEAPKSRRRRDEEEDEDEDDRVSTRRRSRDDDEDDDRGSLQPSRRDVRQGWERVRFGVNLVIIANWIGVGTAVAAVVAWLILFLVVGFSFASMFSTAAGSVGGPPNQKMPGQVAGQAAGTMMGAFVGGCAVVALIGLLMLARLATQITGFGFCMGIAPTRKTQVLKGLAIAAFSLAIANLVIPLLTSGANAMFARYGGGCFGFAGQGLWGLLALAEIVCFLLFLRGVAAVMRRDDLARNIVIFMISLPVAFVTVVVAAIILVFGGMATVIGAASSSGSNQAAVQNGANAAAGFAILGLVCFGIEVLIGLGLFVWYMVLLYQVRSTVDRWLDRN